MRKYILLLMTLCSLNVFAAELPPAPQPEVLKAAIKEFTAAHCNERTTQRSVIPNVNNISQTTVAIYKFRCNARDVKLETLVNAFDKDKESSYKYVHELPKTGPLYSTMLGDRRVVTRDSQSKEYYMLCAKNPQNPRDRDMYALSFVTKDSVCDGNLYLITSPRPEYDPSQSIQKDKKEKENWQWVVVHVLFNEEMRNKCEYFVCLNKKFGNCTSAEMDHGGKFTTSYWLKEDTKLLLEAIPKDSDKKNAPRLRWVGTFVPGQDYYFIASPDGFKNVTRDEYLSFGKSEKNDFPVDSKLEKLITKHILNAQARDIMTNYGSVIYHINLQTKCLVKVDKEDPYYDEAQRNMAELNKYATKIAAMMSDYDKFLESQKK